MVAAPGLRLRDPIAERVLDADVSRAKHDAAAQRPSFSQAVSRSRSALSTFGPEIVSFGLR